ncbi:unnamed protein product [Blepharisma stoltei]|uniref:PX domain-containing protein n=1 Tax=Blepharisma stoltei TaxID=1481888 RepID=A0AAU9JNV1_9CILI|nr:unnamed protein product [Blepharisma stoltei]
MGSEYEEEDFLTEAERKAKRKFLREEILDMHYDQELFTWFFESKEKGDIDDWTFDDLQLCVRQFKLLYRPGQSLEDIENQAKKEEESKNKSRQIVPSPKNQSAKDSEEKKSEIDYSIQPHTPKTNFSDSSNPQVEKLPTAMNENSKNSEEINQPENDPEFDADILVCQDEDPRHSEEKFYEISCRQLPETELSQYDNLEIDISFPELVQGGLFSPQYLVYTIKTSPFQWSVKRRYTDFIWLREVMLLEIPGNFIPPVQQKKIKENIDEEKTIKRQMILKRFIKTLIRNPLTRKSAHLLEFLKDENAKGFQNYRKQASKAKKIENINQFVSLDGKLKCSTSQRKMEIQKLNEYIMSSEALKKRIKKQGMSVMEDLNRLSESLNGYAELLKQFASIQEILPYNLGNKDLYLHLHQAISNWSKHEQEKISDINEYFMMHFKFMYKELDALKELLKETEQNEMNFMKNANRKAKDIENIRALYGNSITQCLSEGERVILDSAWLSNIHFWEMARHQADNTIQYHLIWGFLMAKLLETRHEKIPERPNIPQGKKNT